MFLIEDSAKEYIAGKCRGAVTIVLDFQPMMGGG